MKIANITRAFGMSVQQFADACGYSRQTFYCSEIRDSEKSRAMIHNLKGLNESMLRMDLEEAQRKHEERLRAIDDLEQRIKKTGVNADDHD